MAATTRAVALAGGLGLLLGAGVFWLPSGTRGRAPASAEAHETPAAVAQDDRPAVAPLLAAAALRSAIRDEIRAAVHDEAAAVTKPAEEPAPAPAVKEPAPPTPSYEKASAHVADRLAEGSWSNADRERMQEMLGDMTDEERSAVMRKVIVAANKGQLRVQLTGPLF
jgi:hypothetical protein